MISIITPFVRSDSQYLLDAYASFSDSTIKFEWLVQEDGSDPVGMCEEILSDPRVSYRANGMSLGAGGSRTMALLRATGELVVLLDADDLLAPGALERYASCFDPDTGWAYGQCVAWEQETLTVERSILEPRTYRPGELLEVARTLGHLPMYSLPGCFRREVLERIGGWPSIPRDEDTTVQLCAFATSPGVVLEEVTYIKRQHQNRTSVQPWMERMRQDCRSLAPRRLGLDPNEWEDWISGGRETGSLYVREPYPNRPVPASVCDRCARVFNRVWCPSCGERAASSYAD